MKINFNPTKLNRLINSVYYLDNQKLITGEQELDDNFVNHPDWELLLAIQAVELIEEAKLTRDSLPTPIKSRKKASKRSDEDALDSVENYTIFDENV